MRVLHALQHLQLVVDHLLVSTNILLQDDLNGDLALGAVGLSDDTICSGAQCLSEAVSRPAIVELSIRWLRGHGAGYELAIIAVRLAVQLVEHVCHWRRALVLGFG